MEVLWYDVVVVVVIHEAQVLVVFINEFLCAILISTLVAILHLYFPAPVTEDVIPSLNLRLLFL